MRAPGGKRTIFAPASGIGRAAICVVRISGPSSNAALQALTDGPLPEERRASLKTLRDPTTGEVLDRALTLRFRAPTSYTGEDAVELQLTGGRAVVGAVLRSLGSLDDLRPAEPGEFALRAFENGKLDLSQVEGLADLVDAETEAQRRQALRIASGALSRLAEDLRGQILEAMAWVEAAIDFSDQEDVTDSTFQRAAATAESAATQLRETLRNAERGERLRDGFNVVIAGPPNVGKSTLMNALARRDVAIVSDTPGTTRDPIEVHLDLRGLPVVLVDTAGIRDTDDPIEMEGVARARRRAAEADLILWLSDRGDPAPATIQSTAALVLSVRTKTDLTLAKGPPSAVGISAKTGFGIEHLLDLISEAAEEQLSGADQSLIAAARHRVAFEEALSNLERATSSENQAPEFLAEDLRLAARALERIAGRIDVEDVLGEIFSRLCIGK
ncbi:MAG TPA: tRNA uridine-5-carboxymethylaminomethyl(34) synthesis GTPase MnmE [Roseiarcus sp.]|nr:tRNA uridine-5-carboxymethylaminomethyl(34) synthesis GTPase MnmE [Roseiarcus sp.]